MLRVVLLSLLTGLSFIGLSQNSVLSTGNWLKLGVAESGIYRIDQNFLSSHGIAVDSFDPRTLKIYGNGGGGILPQGLSKARIDDLKENAVRRVGLADGRFDEEDYLLFYGNNPHNIGLVNGQWIFRRNIYSDTSYYFMTYGGDAGLVLEEIDLPILDADNSINQYQKIIMHEEDEFNILASGREWYGEILNRSSPNLSFNFPTPDLVDSIFISLDLLGRSSERTTVHVESNGTLLGEISILPINSGPSATYDIKGRASSGFFAFPGIKNSENPIQLRLINPGDPDLLQVHLDRLIFSYNSELRYDNSQILIRNKLSLAEGNSYRIMSDTPLTIWDVSDATQAKEVSIIFESGGVVFQTDSPGPFIAFEESRAMLPVSFGAVQNQNLHGLNPKDGLIITSSVFLTDAERLAEFHNRWDGLDVEVVTVDQIYNEFSSGRQDVTALRDATRYFYNRNPSSFKYLLLFGDCSYDYKDRINNNTNFVPVYESYNSVDPVETYSSEDFFGFLEQDEGEWEELSTIDTHDLEVGVGRLPVGDATEARDVVDKLISYATNTNSAGDWKNKVTYVVDDGDGNGHMRDAEELSEFLNARNPQFSINKLYLDAREQEILADEETAEETRDALERAINEGTFFVNYLGHGSEARWADETVLDFEFINALTNNQKLPVFLTATCEFGRYDQPVIPITVGHSGAEELLFNPTGGAIALLTTTRPVYSTSNLLVNRAFHEFFFDPSLRLGDVVRHTKNNSVDGVRNRNFALLGDPMLKLKHPEFDVRIRSVNGKRLGENEIDTLSALELIHLEGYVSDQDGNAITNFNGEVSIDVFDRKQSKTTLGQQGSVFEYLVRENRLFKGSATVIDGMFHTEFIVPKNITYKFDQGTFTFYAFDNNQLLEATGFSTNFVIGGTSESSLNDLTPPEISIFLNDESFKNGDIVGSGSIFFARISDESGINMSGLGISQDITLNIGDEKFDLNQYYSASLDDYTQGNILFPLEIEEPGKYSATLKVWDVHNNLSSKTVDFVVSERPVIRISNLINYPNPAIGETTIRFDHDRYDEELIIRMEVFNSKGSILFSEEFKTDGIGRSVEGYTLNLRSDLFQPGQYFYRVSATSLIDGVEGHSINRLLITK